MQVIDFASDDAMTKAAFKIRQLKPREACIFHHGSSTPLPMQLAVLRKAISRSSRVVWTITEAETRDREFMKHVANLNGLFAVSVKLKLTDSLRIQHTGRNSTGDPILLGRYRELRDEADGRYEVIPEISLDTGLDYLGPTLMELGLLAPPWIVLHSFERPDNKRVEILKRVFEYLEIRGFPQVEIHFPFKHEFAKSWKVLSGCFFSGPDDIHIDVSNKCTHSCIFCAVYAPGVVKEIKDLNGGALDEYTKKFMAAQLPFEKAASIIESLPVTTRAIQFGGAGDPMTHPRALDLIALARSRGFSVEVLTNMEYFKEGELERLSRLGARDPEALRIIANVSAATPETYVLTRPRQTEATFRKVVANMRELSRLREADEGHGVHFDLMCVTNRHNYKEASDFVRLALEVRAHRVWFKPVEVHHKDHYDLLPKKEERSDYLRLLREAFALAESHGLIVEHGLGAEGSTMKEEAHVRR